MTRTQGIQLGDEVRDDEAVTGGMETRMQVMLARWNPGAWSSV